MAVTKNHVELGLVKKNGDVDVLYLKNQGKDVEISRDQNAKIPSTVQNVQDLANNLKDLAFGDGENLVYIGEANDLNGSLPPLSEINNTDQLSLTSTWSSQKISDKCTTFIPSYETIDYDRLYTSPKIMVLNTEGDGTVTSPIPGSPAQCQYLIKYYPIVTIATSIEGAPGAPNTPRIAYQEWTIISTNTGKPEPYTMYIRYYVGNQWQEFKKVQFPVA